MKKSGDTNNHNNHSSSGGDAKGAEGSSLPKKNERKGSNHHWKRGKKKKNNNNAPNNYHKKEAASSSSSSRLCRLLQQAGKGDKRGCLEIIQSMSSEELNECISSNYTPTSSPQKKKGQQRRERETGVTVLLVAVELQDLEVIRALLDRGANSAARTSPTSDYPAGRDPWSAACAIGGFEAMEALCSFITPITHPNGLCQLLQSAEHFFPMSTKEQLHKILDTAGQTKDQEAKSSHEYAGPSKDSQVSKASSSSPSKSMDEIFLSLLGQLLSHEGWADMMPITTPRPQWKSILHLCINLMLPLSVLQALLQYGFRESLQEVDNEGFTPLQLVERNLNAVYQHISRAVDKKIKQDSRKRDKDAQNEDGSATIVSENCSDSSSSDSEDWGSFLSTESEESSDMESDSSEESCTDEDDEEEDEDDLDDHRHASRPKGESDVGDWAYLDDTFLFDLSEKEERLCSDLEDRLAEYALSFVGAMGAVAAFTSTIGLSTTVGRRTVLQRRPVFSLLDEICNASSTHEKEAFALSSWVSPDKSLASCWSRAESGSDGSEPCSKKFVDPGFHLDEEEKSLMPSISIILEAARLYSAQHVLPHDVSRGGSHLSEHCENMYTGKYRCRLLSATGRLYYPAAIDSWVGWFLEQKNPSGISDSLEYDAPSDKSLRCVIWVLCCTHHRVRDRHIRTWAHILRDLTAFLAAQPCHDLSTMSGTNCLSVLVSSVSDASEMSSEETLRFAAPIVTDPRLDPLPGLSHPSVAALVLDKIGDMGYCLLYNLTGQVVSDDGEVIELYEEEMFNSVLELFLCVVSPRLGAYHKCLIIEASVEVGKSKKHRRKNMKDNLKEIDINLENLSIEESQISLNELEESKFYKSSIGRTSVKSLISSGRVLLPLEAPEKRPDDRGSGKQGFVKVSMLRFVTESFKTEILTLWQAVDNMLSLFANAIVDDGDRLASLIRGMHAWMVIDEATTSFCPRASLDDKNRLSFASLQKRRRDTDESFETVGSRFVWEPWSVVAATASQNVNVIHCFNRRDWKQLRWHGDSTALDFISSAQPRWVTARVMQASIYARDGFLDTTSVQLRSLEMPKKFSDICRVRRDGLSALVDCDSHDARLNLLSTHLECLLRVPWVLEQQQRMDVALNTLNDGVQRRHRHLEIQRVREQELLGEDLRPAKASNLFNDVEIHLNRFTDESVWLESILQQLLMVVKDPLEVDPLVDYMNSKPLLQLPKRRQGSNKGRKLKLKPCNDLYRAELSVLYQGEAGTGPGPLKELLEMCRTSMFSVQPISSQNRPEQKRKGRGPSPPLHLFFPLLRPAGESHPEELVPLEVESVLHSLKSRCCSGEESFGRLRQTVLRLFESLGVVLGISIRSQGPLGIAFPRFVWRELLQQPPLSRDPLEDSSAGGRPDWRELVGSDEAMKQSLEQLLAMPAEEVSAMGLSFEGVCTSWQPLEKRLVLTEVPLEPPKAWKAKLGPAERVTATNRLAYVQSYTRRRYFPKEMRVSVLAIRRGLLRVIPQALLNMMSEEHVAQFVKGDATIDVNELRMLVQYEDYEENHRVIKLFWRILEHDLADEERRSLLQFWTGSSVPPRGGFVAGSEYDDMMISRLRFPRSANAPMLPEASTCDKHLYLPEYSTHEEMLRAIRSALTFSAMGFDKP